MALYDTLAADYDRFVDWPARLAFELPFLERLFAAHGVRRVLDAACGTGRHVLRPGGLVVIQNRNYDKVWRERQRFMPLQAHREGDREWLFFRSMDFHEATMTFNVATIARSGEEWSYHVGSTELRPIFQDELAAWLPAAGFHDPHFYGSYDGTVFDPGASGDLIAVATRN